MTDEQILEKATIALRNLRFGNRYAEIGSMIISDGTFGGYYGDFKDFILEFKKELEKSSEN